MALLLSGVVSLECFYLSKLHMPLLPLNEGDFPLRAVVSSDADDGGQSTYEVRDSSHLLQYQFLLVDKVDYPYVSLALRFVQQEQALDRYVDLSGYSTATFTVQCQPANILSFTAYTFDEKVSKPGVISSLRIPSTYFSCSPNPTPIEIHLDKLETPEWWLKKNVTLASRHYSLQKTAGITFGNSIQSPIGVASSVAIQHLALEGWNWPRVILGVILLTLIWTAFFLFLFKGYIKTITTDIQARLQKKIPLTAYQQVSMDCHKNKERNALLTFMMTEYCNPDMDMDKVIQQLGMNRTKINNILKSEVGLTFNAYLNKLRLTEAARLLAENAEASIAEVAYSVGYNNASYFNRLFKAEYGCAPKAFKSTMPAISAVSKC